MGVPVDVAMRMSARGGSVGARDEGGGEDSNTTSSRGPSKALIRGKRAACRRQRVLSEAGSAPELRVGR